MNRGRTLPGRRAWRAALLALALLAAGARPVLAHAELLTADPPAGATVRPGLAEIRLTFNEAVRPESRIVVYAAGLQAVPGVESRVEGVVLVGRLTEPLAAGTFTVQWRAMGTDGHPVEGSYPFAIGAADPTAGSTNWSKTALIAAISTIIMGGVGVFVWLLERYNRSRERV